MNSHADRAARRLIALKKMQAQLTAAAANRQAQSAQEQRERAMQARHSARTAVQAALPQPEQGLNRRALYERLRWLAVARAHALESLQEATELEQRAAACDAQEQTLRLVAATHRRKQAKIEHWQQRSFRLAARLHQQRLYAQQLDSLLCRRRPSF